MSDPIQLIFYVIQSWLQSKMGWAHTEEKLTNIIYESLPQVPVIRPLGRPKARQKGQVQKKIAEMGPEEEDARDTREAAVGCW